MTCEMPFIFDEDGELILPIPQDTNYLAVTALPSALPMAVEGDPLLGGGADILDVCDVHPLMLAEDGGMKSFCLRLMECYLRRN